MKEKADYKFACEVNTTRRCFVAGRSACEILVIRAFIGLVGRHRRGLAGDLAAALPGFGGALRFLNYKRRDSFNKVWQLRDKP